MSTPDTTEDAVRELLLVMPRLVGRVKRLPLPEQLQSLDLAPRHLSMLSLLLLDGPLTVSQLARMLGVAPTTVRSEEHTSELQSRSDLVCRLLLEKKKKIVLRTRSCVGGTRVGRTRGECKASKSHGSWASWGSFMVGVLGASFGSLQ